MSAYDITIDVTVEQGTCCICRMEPRGPQLDLVLRKSWNRTYAVTICRDCLAEHAPNLLHDIEAGE